MEPSTLCDLPSVSDFVNSVESCLKNGQTEKVLTILEDNEYGSIVQNNLWNLIPLLTKYLTSEAEQNTPNEFKCCQKVINLIAQKSNAEEALLEFIEEIEEAEDDVKYLNLLTPLKYTLMRTPHKKINSFAWAFNAIEKYLRKLPVPEELDFTGSEKLLLDCNSDFQRITFIYFELIPFYEFFVEDFCVSKVSGAEQKMLLCKYLIQLLDKPLSYLDLEECEKTVGRARRIAEKIVDFVLKLCGDPYIYFEVEEEDSEFKRPPTLGLAVLYYIVTNTKTSKSIPKVYDSIFIFQNMLKFIKELLIQGKQCCTEAGLSLTNNCLKTVQEMNLTYMLLDSGDHCRFCSQLTNTIIYNPNEHTRKWALSLLKTYLYAFELRGQYLIIYNMMGILNHTGLIGFIITIYKDLLARELSKNETQLSIYFVGERLWALLSRFCHLPSKEESDLLELSDQIISSLNLLRFLVIRDKDNVTHFKTYLNIIKENYLEPLKQGIIMSRAHYELKVKDIEEEIKNNKPCVVSVTVCGRNLPEMSREEKKRVLMSSLTAFDVMDSLLCRLNECIEAM